MWCGPAARGGSCPSDFPPWQTVYWYFNQWEQAAGHRADPARAARAGARCRRVATPSPAPGIIDSQSVKGADTVGRDTRGYDAGKKINGRKRFIVTDTLGLLLVVVVLAASVQDRDGAKSVLLDTYLRTPVRFVFADGGFAGTLRRLGQPRSCAPPLHIVRKPAGQTAASR